MKQERKMQKKIGLDNAGIYISKFNQCLYKLSVTMYELLPCPADCETDRMNCMDRVLDLHRGKTFH